MTKIAITGLVTIHLAATLWHGSAHTQLTIALPPEKNIFAYIVILIAPIVRRGAGVPLARGALRYARA